MAEIAPGQAKEISFEVQSVPIVYNAAAQKISCLGSQAPLVPKDGNISLHIFVDRAAVDIFGGGSLYVPMRPKAFLAEEKALETFVSVAATPRLLH